MSTRTYISVRIKDKDIGNAASALRHVGDVTNPLLTMGYKWV